MNTTKTAILAVIAGFLTLSTSIGAEAVSEKAKAKRHETLRYLVFLEVPLKNFGSEAQNKKFAELKEKYTVALGFYFEDNFLEAYRTFLDAQGEAEKLYEDLSLAYIDRTSTILQEAAKDVVDIQISFDRKSSLVQKYLDPIEPQTPPQEKRVYNPKDFHFVYDKAPIVNNLDHGFEMLGQAKRIRQEALDLEKWIEDKKDLGPQMRKKRIDYYMVTIQLCRDAKQNGINVFQMVNTNEIYSVQNDLKNNPFVVEKRLDPVFDPRIPEKYRIDANDSLNRVHADEVELKLARQNENKGSNPAQSK